MLEFYLPLQEADLDEEKMGSKLFYHGLLLNLIILYVNIYLISLLSFSAVSVVAVSYFRTNLLLLFGLVMAAP